MDKRKSRSVFNQSALENEYLRAESDRLNDLCKDDPKGRLLFVTMTFPGRRFASTSWSSGDARRALYRIDRASDDLHRTFRAFYLKTLTKAVDDYRHRNNLQPTVVAFVDDRQADELEPYPHIHSVWFAPSDVEAAVTAWLGSYDAVRAWADMSQGGSINVVEVDSDPNSVRRVVAYAGKLLVGAAAAGVATQALSRTYPDRPRRVICEAPRPPRQGHEQPAVSRAPRRSRSHRGRALRSTPIAIVKLPRAASGAIR